MKWDHLFEWYLSQQLAKQTVAKIRESKKLGKVHRLEKTDLAALHLAYNLRGQLSLADIKPTGFFVRSRV